MPPASDLVRRCDWFMYVPVLPSHTECQYLRSQKPPGSSIPSPLYFFLLERVCYQVIMTEVHDEEFGVGQRRSSFLHTLKSLNAKNPSQTFVKKRSTTLDQTTLKFDDIYFLVGKPSKKNPAPKKILTKVSGKVQYGRVLAIMGPSGAG